MTRSPARTARLTTFSLVLGLGGCGAGADSVAPPVPSTVVADSPTSVTGVAGNAIASPTVVVKDQRGAPMVGVPVRFAVTAGGGTVSVGAVLTDASGRAAVALWTLGTVAGSNALSATVSGLPPIAFTATGTPGAPRNLHIRAETDGQTAPAGTDVLIPPSVEVTDEYGNPISGVSAVFAVSGGGGSVRGGAQTTNSAGSATVGAWRLGNIAGPNRLTLTVGSFSPWTLTATGT
jgi:hypothetical protein